MMNFLIANGADVTYVNADGDLPLDNAEGGKCVKILEAEYSRMGLSEDDLQSHREGKGKQLQKKVDEMYVVVPRLSLGSQFGLRVRCR
jgi:hypothetical protein